MPRMTVTEFIAALGGNSSAAAAFGVGASAVCNWKATNRMPARLHLKALRLAAERGLSFDPEAPVKKRRKAA
jgi:hypothetical protein